jgi:hypothetical protein
MSTLNFPTSPSLDDTYSFGTKTWIWNGSAWQLQATGAINNTPIGNITPSTGAFTTITASSTISAVGNITGNYFIGNGSALTGLPEGYGNANVAAYLPTYTGNLVSLTGAVTTTANITGNYFVGNGSQLTGINSFSTIAVSGQSSVTADSIADTLTLAAGSGIEIVTNAGTDTITINSTDGVSIFATGGNMGTVDEAVTAEEDLGLITNAITQSYDLGTIILGGLVWPTQLVLPSFTVAEIASLPANPVGQMVICTNEAGGTVPAFSDGTDWRRVTDRAVIT